LYNNSICPESNLEQEIVQIEKQLAEKKAVLEQQKTEKEMLHEVVGEKIQTTAPAELMPVPVPETPPAPAGNIEPQNSNLQESVQNLVNTAFTKSLAKAIQEAKETHNPVLLDAFHDALVNELYDYLIEQGKLKKI